MSFNFGWTPLIRQAIKQYFASAAQGVLANSAIQPSAVGVSVQGYSTELNQISTLGIDPSIQHGRLTTNSSDPDVDIESSPTSTVHFLPYKGNQISLFDGTKWRLHSFGAKSLEISGNNVIYDIYATGNGINDITLSSIAWPNLTARAAEPSRQNGILVSPGDPEKKYLGSAMVGADGLITYDQHYRFIWNYYNQTPKFTRRYFSGGTHTYSSTTARYMNGESNQDIRFICGQKQSCMLSFHADVGRFATVNLANNFLQGSEVIFPSQVENNISSGNDSVGATQAASLDAGFQKINMIEASLDGSLFTVSKNNRTGFSVLWEC